MIWEVNGLENWTGKTKKRKKNLGEEIYFPFLYMEQVHSGLRNIGDK